MYCLFTHDQIIIIYIWFIFSWYSNYTTLCTNWLFYSGLYFQHIVHLKRLLWIFCTIMYGICIGEYIDRTIFLDKMKRRIINSTKGIWKTKNGRLLYGQVGCEKQMKRKFKFSHSIRCYILKVINSLDRIYFYVHVLTIYI